MSLNFSSSSKNLGSRKCLYCGDNKQYAQVLRIPENASALPKWIERFGNLFFYQIALVHKTLRFVCERHLREVQDRKRDTIDMQMLKSWPQIRFKTVEMEDNKDFELLDVKQERDVEPELLENVEEEKPPILAPPPTIPIYRGQPLPKRRRTEFYQPEVQPSTSEYTHAYQCVDRYNEEVSARFLFGNGLQLSKIEDEHFKNFLNHLNPHRPPPEACHLTTKASLEVRAAYKYTGSGPLSMTVEAIRKNDEVYLSISVHFYDVNKERRNDVHFEKIIWANYGGQMVADRLRRVLDPKKTQNYQITSIVSPNVKMVQVLSEHARFKNKFICFFSYLTNLAKEVIEIEEYKSALKVLKIYVDALKQHPEVMIKLKRLQQSTNFPSTELPSIDLTSPIDWLSTLQSLTTCGILNESLLNLHEGWCMPEYLSISQENALANLSDFLTVLCHVATEICSPDSCVSQVLHSMSIINNAIENCGIRTARSQMRLIFAKYFRSISTGRIGDFYSIAALLDPRYGHSQMIFSESDWQNVENKLVREGSLNGEEVSRAKHRQIHVEVAKYKQAMSTDRPVFDELMTPARWWNAMEDEYPIMYHKWIEYSCPPAVSIDGKRLFGKGGKLAHLFSTLDELMHHKATLLAQSSQDFVGRGSASLMIFDQIRDVTVTFRRLEDEPDEDGDDSQDQKPDVETLEDVVVKQEVPDEYVGPAPESGDGLRDVKLEEIDEPEYN